MPQVSAKVVAENRVLIYHRGVLGLIRKVQTLFIGKPRTVPYTTANDLSLCVPEIVIVVQYADDVQLMVTGKKCDVQQLIGRMEDALSSVYQRFCHNGMKLSAKKTQMLVLGTQMMLRDLPPVTLRFCGNVISDSKVVENLNISLDHHLNLQTHIDRMPRKCTGILMALNHARHVIPKSALKGITKALVLSVVVRYCVSVYGACTEMQLHCAQKTVNFCTRAVAGKRRRDHLSGIVTQLGWLTAKQPVAYHTGVHFQSLCPTGQATVSSVADEPPAKKSSSFPCR